MFAFLATVASAIAVFAPETLHQNVLETPSSDSPPAYQLILSESSTNLEGTSAYLGTIHEVNQGWREKLLANPEHKTPSKLNEEVRDYIGGVASSRSGHWYDGNPSRFRVAVSEYETRSEGMDRR